MANKDYIKTVVLNDSLRESFFHFTGEENLINIQEIGLQPRIGMNSNGLEKTSKIFFSKGFDGLLQNLDVWIKYKFHRAFNEVDGYGFYKGKTIEERKRLVEEWEKEFLSKDYLKDDEKKEKVFEKIYKGIKTQKYLLLDLEKEIDFKYNDIDEIKEYNLEEKNKGNSTRYLYAKEMYGNYSNVDSNIVDKWNMHTLPNYGVAKEKISKVITKDGKDDALSILQYIYINYRNKEDKYDILDDFMTYSFKRDKNKTE